MGKTKKCPACGAQVDAEQQHCPNCPYSFFEEDGVQHYRKGRSRQHYFWAVAVALSFVGAYKVLNFVMRFADADDSAYSPIRQAAEDMAVSSATAKTPEQLAQEEDERRAREEVQRAVSHGRVQVVSGSDVPEAPAPARLARVSAPAPASEDSEPPAPLAASRLQPEEPEAKEWRFRGCVYDLVTLKPVPHATLVIKDAESDRRFELVTGGDGRYRTTVPTLPNRGYVIAVSHQDYAPTYVDPETKGIRAKSERQRRDMARELSHVLDGGYAVQGGRKPVVTDFYLAPLR